MIKTKHREIKTTIPHPLTKYFLEKLRIYEANSASEQLPIVWDMAKDFYVFDRWGNKFIDFSSGIFVTNIGHGKISGRIISQLSEYLVYSYNFPTVVRYELLKKL